MTLIQLYNIAEQNDISVYHFQLNPIKSMSIPETIGIDADQLNNTTEEKELLAHELGHCIKRSFYTGSSSLELRSKMEYSANKWAVQNLIPYQDLIEALEHGITEIWDLSEYFEVSDDLIIMAFNLYECELINYINTRP